MWDQRNHERHEITRKQKTLDVGPTKPRKTRNHTKTEDTRCGTNETTKDTKSHEKKKSKKGDRRPRESSAEAVPPPLLGASPLHLSCVFVFFVVIPPGLWRTDPSSLSCESV